MTEERKLDDDVLGGGLIFKGDGKPFANEHAAKIQAKRILNKDKIRTKVIAMPDGSGFALKRLYEKRKKRVPMGRRNVLTYPQIPGYVTRVFNDDPKDMGQRLAAAEDAGWEYVRSEVDFGDRYAGKPTSTGSTVNRPVGHGTTGVLMKKKIEWHEEDEQAKQDDIDAKENQLVAQADVDGRYGKVDLKVKRPVAKIAKS